MLLFQSTQYASNTRLFSKEALEIIKSTFSYCELNSYYKSVFGTTISIIVSENRAQSGMDYKDNRLIINMGYFNSAKENPLKFTLEAIKTMQAARKNSSKTKCTPLSKEENNAFERSIKTIERKIMLKETIPIKIEQEGKYTKSKIFISQKYVDAYKKLKNKENLSLEAFTYAYSIYEGATDAGKAKKGKFLLEDLNKNSKEKRFYLINTNTMEVEHSCNSAHGFASDKNKDGWVDSVSNKKGSYKSSSGAYILKKGKNEKFGHFWMPAGISTTNYNSIERGTWLHYLRGNYSGGCHTIKVEDAKKIGLALKDYSAPASNWEGYLFISYYDKKVQNSYKKKQ